MSTFHHPTLNATLIGLQNRTHGVDIKHYRGIKYASIAKRFGESQLAENWDGLDLDCTRFGPDCPQNYVEVEHLLRVPSVQRQDRDETSEFDCLNINVSVPAGTGKDLLPVFVWIHGGSQVVSFPPASHKASDPTVLLVQAVLSNRPFIFITFNYRLNIFAFGNGSTVNLALRDQRLAIEWVSKHVAGFGGDKDNITLCGQSAGAVYCHALVVTGSPVRRGILQSGSLSLSPPLPLARGQQLIEKFSRNLRERIGQNIDEAPVEQLMQQLKIENINTMWLQHEADLEGWEERLGDLPDLMIGDAEFESIIWQKGIGQFRAEEIDRIFSNPNDEKTSKALKHAYKISKTDDSASLQGALNFITDVRFAKPVHDMASKRKTEKGTRTFRYAFDQPSPFEPGGRSHHAVDLLFLFGSYAEDFTIKQQTLGRVMRDKWIDFIYGRDPWNEEKIFGFGPQESSGEIHEEGMCTRRRVEIWHLLDAVGNVELGRIVGELTSGRISLMN